MIKAKKIGKKFFQSGFEIANKTSVAHVIITFACKLFSDLYTDIKTIVIDNFN